MRPSLWADRLVSLLVRFVGLLILLAALVAATASFLYNKAEDADRADRIAMQVNMRLRDHVAVLQGVRALYQSAPTSHGSSIRAYIAALRPQERVPGMEGIGIAVAMRQDTPAAAETMLRENYGRDIKVWPATSQPIGFPIVLIEPDNPRRNNALGYDMFSEPVRREAMRRAWQTGHPAASSIVRLMQEKGIAHKQLGFLIYIPIYAAGLEQNGADRPIEAFVYAPFRTDDLFTAILGSQLDTIGGIEIFAGEGPSAPLAFRHGKMGWDTHLEKLRVADREWTMRISYGRQFERLGRPFAIFLFGLALALLATQLHRVQQRRVGAAQALAEEQARHAADRELMIGEMAHRMKNALARISALARITLRESQSLEEFETRFDGRMRALSETKQMLVTGAVSSVELGRIVRRELEVAGWPQERLAKISGAEVYLDDEGAQAISLAVHEFVTNSIKYGALSGVGDLSVGWRRDGDTIEFDWVESGLAEIPNIECESFGTQFIRTLIERQLKGKWTRTVADRALHITLRWPDHVAHA